MQRFSLLLSSVSRSKSTLVGNAITRHLQRVISLNTRKCYIKDRSINVGNVTVRKLQWTVLINTSEPYMEERSSTAGNVITRIL